MDNIMDIIWSQWWTSIITWIASVATSYATIKTIVDWHEKRIAKIEQEQWTINNTFTEIKVSLAKIESDLEYLKSKKK